MVKGSDLKSDVIFTQEFEPLRLLELKFDYRKRVISAFAEFKELGQWYAIAFYIRHCFADVKSRAPVKRSRRW